MDELLLRRRATRSAPWWVLLVLCGLLGATTACGSAGGGAAAPTAPPPAAAGTVSPAPQASPTVAAAPQEIPVELKEWTIEPKELVAKPGRVTFLLKNVGERRHNMVVEVAGQPVKSLDVSAGTTGSLEVTLPAPGTYAVYCDLQNHRERGMEGTLTVQP
jgi:plastocyanin